MNFNQLESTIHDLISDTIDNFSIFIQTDEGNITINAYEPRKAASVIKLPILIEAYRQIENNMLQPDTLVYVEKDMKVGGAGVINYLTNCNVYSYKNLLELMIIVSDNTAANLILDKIGMHQINSLATKLTCTHTKIARKFMDQVAPLAGVDNYTSAKDILQYLKLVGEPNNLVNEDSRKQMLEILLHQQLKDKLSSYLNDDSGISIFHKTGELPGVEHDVAIFNYQAKNVYAAILTEGWTTNGNGKRYIGEIGKYLIEYITF